MNFINRSDPQTSHIISTCSHGHNLTVRITGAVTAFCMFCQYTKNTGNSNYLQTSAALFQATSDALQSWHLAQTWPKRRASAGLRFYPVMTFGAHVAQAVCVPWTSFLPSHDIWRTRGPSSVRPLNFVFTVSVVKDRCLHVRTKLCKRGAYSRLAACIYI